MNQFAAAPERDPNFLPKPRNRREASPWCRKRHQNRHHREVSRFRGKRTFRFTGYRLKFRLS